MVTLGPPLDLWKVNTRLHLCPLPPPLPYILETLDQFAPTLPAHCIRTFSCSKQLGIHNQTWPMVLREGSELLKGLHFLPRYTQWWLVEPYPTQVLSGYLIGWTIPNRAGQLLQQKDVPHASLESCTVLRLQSGFMKGMGGGILEFSPSSPHPSPTPPFPLSQPLPLPLPFSFPVHVHFISSQFPNYNV